MSTLLLRPGETLVLDPSDKRVVHFDWDTENLAAGAVITSSSWSVGVLKQTGPTPLTYDSQLIIGTRYTQIRLLATTTRAGDQYTLANKIVTNESPNQEKEQSINVLIKNR